MTIITAQKEITEYANAAQADGDRYLFVHFSREEDRFGAFQNIDSTDAKLVIKGLAKHFGIDLEVMAEAVK